MDKHHSAENTSKTHHDSPPETQHTTHNSDKRRAAFNIGVVAICFAAIAAAWSFIGGACCGWAGWIFAFVGLVLSIVSLVMKPSALAWWALGLSIFAFAWVFIAAASFGNAVNQSVNNYNNYNSR